MIHRRTLLQLGAVVAMGQVGWAWSAGAVLPAPQSLKEELAKALATGNPLVIMVSLERCPFCKVARDSYLEPLRRQEGIPTESWTGRTAAAPVPGTALFRPAAGG